MRDLFDRLVSGGEAEIRRLIGRQEDIDFDAKRKSDPLSGAPSKDDKETLGRVLSAMANSMGGLVIWGLDARKDSAQVDRVVDVAPITGIARFESEMRSLAAEALMPRHPGVTIRRIPCEEDQKRGYLAVLVERSDRRPHRCELGSQKYYYRRIGSSSRAMEHYEIEDAFTRQHVPTLKVIARLADSDEWGHRFRTNAAGDSD